MDKDIDDLSDAVFGFEREESFAIICGVSVDKQQAREILRSLVATLIDSIENEKYNAAYNIVMQDDKFVELLTLLRNDFETTQIQNFVASINTQKETE